MSSNLPEQTLEELVDRLTRLTAEHVCISEAYNKVVETNNDALHKLREEKPSNPQALEAMCVRLQNTSVEFHRDINRLMPLIKQAIYDANYLVAKQKSEGN
jgi:hypothetical protein